MFKILHTADLHLGLKQFDLYPRLLDMGAVLDGIYEIAVRERVDLVVAAGDVFNSPDPDPYSVAKHNEFVQKLRGAGIQYLVLVGNHDRHPDEVKESPPWVATSGLDVLKAPGIAVALEIHGQTQALHIAATDWIHPEEISRYLTSLPPGTDAVFMHQSCGGFLPVIAHPEVTLEQLDAAPASVRYFGLGDLHISKTLTTPRGTMVSYPGSTELTKTDEAVEKFVNIVEFGDSPRSVEIRRVRLETRGFLTFDTIMSEPDLAAAREKILADHSDPLIYIPYDRNLNRQIRGLRQELKEKGYTRVKSVPTSSVDSTNTLAAAKESASTDMNEILAEELEGTPLVHTAQAIWTNPDNLPGILQDLKNRCFQNLPPL